MSLALGAALFLVVGLLVLSAELTRRRPYALTTVTVTPETVTVVVRAPVWLAFRRRLVVPRSAVVAVREAAPGPQPDLLLRLCGAGWYHLALGWFWRSGIGACYVVRRVDHRAVEMDLTGQWTRRWIVEVESVEDVLAAFAVRPAG